MNDSKKAVLGCVLTNTGSFIAFMCEKPDPLNLPLGRLKLDPEIKLASYSKVLNNSAFCLSNRQMQLLSLFFVLLFLVKWI